MKKVLILSALLVLALSLPGYAWLVNWTETFEQDSLGALAGQGAWFTPNSTYTDTTTNVVNTKAHSGYKSSMQIVSTTYYSSNIWDLKQSTTSNVPFKAGRAKFWVWDPGTGAGANYRVGIVGMTNMNPGDGGTGVANGSFTANIQDTNLFWRGQFASSPVLLNGTATGSGVGWKFIPYSAYPAPRAATAQWSYVYLSWNVDVNAGSSWVEWAINRSYLFPSLRAEYSTLTTRWAYCGLIQGLSIGDATVKVQTEGRQGYVDDITFGGDPVPEPTSLLALGTGIVGLLGLIRRRR